MKGRFAIACVLATFVVGTLALAQTRPRSVIRSQIIPEILIPEIRIPEIEIPDFVLPDDLLDQWSAVGELAFLPGELFGGVLAGSLLDMQDDYDERDTETIRRTLQFSGSGRKTVEIDNVNGKIDVVGYDGATVEMVAVKTIRARSTARLDEAKRDVKLDIRDGADTVRIYVDGPFRNRDRSRTDRDRDADANDGDGWRRSSRGWRFTGRPDRSLGYNVSVDFEVRVPRDAVVHLKNVNGGPVALRDTNGDFDVSNVNGRIELANVAGSGTVKTVNGRIEAVFRSNPKANSTFKTVNGAIEVRMRPDLNADFLIKTFNGSAFTDFDSSALAPRASQGERRDGKFVYRSNRNTGLRVGQGGPEISLETLNGSIRILKQER